MLKAFRDNLKHLKWVLYIVIAAFGLTVFAVWGGGVQNSAAPGTAVASLGRTEISKAEFQRSYSQIEAEEKARWGDAFSPEIAGQLGLAMRALESIIQDKILIEEAEAMGLEATAKEIQEAILSIPGFTDADGRFIGQENYREFVTRRLSVRYSVSEFEDEIRRGVLRRKFFQIVSQTVYVSGEEIEEAYRAEVDKAEIQYLQLPSDRFADQVSFERADLESYLESHQADYQLPERRRVSYVLIEPHRLRDRIEIEEAEVRAYYDANQDEFSREEQVRARHILRTASDPDDVARVRADLEDVRRRIEAGEDFAALALELSEDEATRDSGGELGFFSRGRRQPALEEAAFSGRVGELVGPIESALVGNQIGLHLIEVQSRREGGIEDYEVAQIAIRSRLLSERSRSRAESEAQELSRRVRSEDLDIAGLEAFAGEEEAATFQSLEPFSSGDNVPGIGRGTAFTAAAFSLEVGKISEPIELTSGQALLHLEEVLEPRMATLDEVEIDVEEALRLELQQSAATERLEALVLEIRGGLTMAAAAESVDLELQDSGEFGRDGFISGLGRQTELTDAVFELSSGEVGGPFATSGGSIVFHVVKRTEWDLVAFETREQEFRERLIQERANALLVSIIESRKAERGGLRPRWESLRSLNIPLPPEAG